MQKNINLIKVSHTVNRLGWQGGEFVPYSDKVKCDSIAEFSGIYKSIASKGNYDLWREHCLKLRENIYLRLTMAASFAAPLIEIIGGLPFIVHLWGGTGAGKTVALNVAASVWGKPSGGLVRTLNGTSYGISETAAFMYSLPCILDELQTIKGGNTSFNQMIMTLTEGMNKTQGAASGGIRQVKQWKNCFICSGEENIVKDNSGGGSINRVISLEVQDTVIEDGNYTMNVISNNYVANEICIALGLIVSLPDRRLYEKLLNYDNQNIMENKLQQLTQKLYDEGLEKGRAEAERLVSEAKSEAAKIIADAKAEAEAIVKAAEAKAEDTAKNSMTEIALAGKQAVARIKEEISSLIAAESTFSAVKAANLDPEFVKAMLLSVARNWNGASSSKVELQALLPEAERAKFDAAFAAAAKELLEAGIEVGYSKEVRTGFKVGAKGGSYYISFSDDDFEALLKEYLRGKISELLFKA